MINIGLRIKELRKSQKLTQDEFSKKANISRTYLSDIENNRYSPSLDTLSNLANHLGVTLEDFFKEDNNENKINIPTEYTDKYKVTTRDKKQYEEEMRKANEAFFMNDELSEDAKKEMLDTMAELFWKAKSIKKENRKNKSK